MINHSNMRQSVYTRISKSLGWESLTAVSIPSIAEANKLYEETIIDQSETAFKEVFKIHRFSGNPQDNDEAEALSTIGLAFHTGTPIFKSQYDDED